MDIVDVIGKALDACIIILKNEGRGSVVVADKATDELPESPSLQYLFTRVKDHLLKQMKQAKNIVNGGCKYRAEAGLKCAVGCLIPDSKYITIMEGVQFYYMGVALGHMDNYVGDIRDKFKPKNGYRKTVFIEILKSINVRWEEDEKIDLLAGLQHLHDQTLPGDWEKNLRKVASRFNLTMSY